MKDGRDGGPVQPRGRRFKEIAADLHAMVEGVTSAWHVPELSTMGVIGPARSRPSWLRTTARSGTHWIDDARANRLTATQRDLPPKQPGFVGDSNDGGVAVEPRGTSGEPPGPRESGGSRLVPRRSTPARSVSATTSFGAQGVSRMRR